MRHGMVCPFKEGAATRTMSGITGHDNSTAVPHSADTSRNSFPSNGSNDCDVWTLLFRGLLQT